MFEGVPDYPKPDRLWSSSSATASRVLGISPTAVRALMPHGPERVHAHDLSSLRILGSTGEPWNPEPYRWLFENAGKARVPIINYTGGTEISGGILGCFPIAPDQAVLVLGADPRHGRRVLRRGRQAGARRRWASWSITRPWPGMTAGFWRDPDALQETYWSRWPDVWVHGDWAYVDEDGFWFIQGRSDDTLKIAGKRLGPAEVESVLVGHPPWPRRRRSASPTRSRARPSSASSCCGRGTRRPTILRAELQRPRGPGDGQGAQARARCCSRAICPRRGAPRSCAG